MAQQALVEDLPNISHVEAFEACALGKQHQTTYPKHEAKRAQLPLELVHGDLV